MFDNLPKRYAAELAAVNDQYPFTPIRYSNPPKRFVWPEVIQVRDIQIVLIMSRVSEDIFLLFLLADAARCG